jgi:hypothetical protein
VPVRVGRQTTFTAMGGGLAFSIFGVAWTAGQATVTGVQLTELTTGGGTQMATSRAFTGMNALTPGGAGTLTLVSPGKVYVSTGNKIPLVGTLTLQYAPEPGTALLTGAGALGLALLARRRGCVPEPVRTSRRRADRGGR